MICCYFKNHNLLKATHRIRGLGVKARDRLSMNPIRRFAGFSLLIFRQDLLVFWEFTTYLHYLISRDLNRYQIEILSKSISFGIFTTHLKNLTRKGSHLSYSVVVYVGYYIVDLHSWTIIVHQ